MNSRLSKQVIKDLHTYLTKENKAIGIMFFCRPIDISCLYSRTDELKKKLKLDRKEDPTCLHMEVLGEQDEIHDSDTLDMIHKIDNFDLVDIFIKVKYSKVSVETLYHHGTPPIDGVEKVDEVLHSFMSSIVFDSI